MNTPMPAPKPAVVMGPWLVVFGGLLLLGIGYLGMRSMFSGIELKPPPIVGEWQAYRTPWRLTIGPDKTLVSSTGPAQPDASQPSTSTRGTYSIDPFGTLWVKLDDGKAYTATLRADWPNQFDLVESATDIVTVFERVLRVPQPIPENVRVRPQGG